MKIVGFEEHGFLHLGVVDGSEVIDLQAVDPAAPRDLGAWLAQTGGDLAPLSALAAHAPASARRALAGLRHALPVARPSKILCLGLNYLDHVAEGPYAANRPQVPTIFLRCLTSLAPHGAALLRPRVCETFDYEAELAVVIGRRAKHLTRDNALDCVAGYSCFNDGSIRAFQRRTSQWDMGKNFDRTGGFGPCFVSADELPAGAAGLAIECRLNGRTVQSSNTGNMMFPVAETLVDITQGMTLEPGDILITGTPSGVGHARKPPLWMKPGDVCEVAIEGIGTLRNSIESER